MRVMKILRIAKRPLQDSGLNVSIIALRSHFELAKAISQTPKKACSEAWEYSKSILTNSS